MTGIITTFRKTPFGNKVKETDSRETATKEELLRAFTKLKTDYECIYIVNTAVKFLYKTYTNYENKIVTRQTLVSGEVTAEYNMTINAAYIWLNDYLQEGN